MKTKGAKNRKTFQVEEIAQKYKLEPIEVLLMAMNGDWKGLGYDSPTTTQFTAAGIEFEVPNLTVTHRIDAAKQACKYLYSAKQTVTVEGGLQPIKIIIEDYTSKK